jgi:hypothetical protein
MQIAQTRGLFEGPRVILTADIHNYSLYSGNNEYYMVNIHKLAEIISSYSKIP